MMPKLPKVLLMKCTPNFGQPGMGPPRCDTGRIICGSCMGTLSSFCPPRF